jgi:hypothetical protein
MPVSPPEQFRTKPNGKNGNLDTITTRHQEMAHLMDENQDGKDDDKGKKSSYDPRHKSIPAEILSWGNGSIF